MKLRQHDVRGYLRAGKVLQLMAMGESSEQGKEGMLEKAAQIYELGIKVVGEEEGGKGRKVSN